MSDEEAKAMSASKWELSVIYRIEKLKKIHSLLVGKCENVKSDLNLLLFFQVQKKLKTFGKTMKQP